MRFPAVIDEAGVVDELLGPNEEYFLRALVDLEGRVQYTVKGRWWAGPERRRWTSSSHTGGSGKGEIPPGFDARSIDLINCVVLMCPLAAYHRLPMRATRVIVRARAHSTSVSSCRRPARMSMSGPRMWGSSAPTSCRGTADPSVMLNRPGCGGGSLVESQATRLIRSPSSYRASNSVGGLYPQAP